MKKDDELIPDGDYIPSSSYSGFADSTSFLQFSNVSIEEQHQLRVPRKPFPPHTTIFFFIAWAILDIVVEF